jgi:ring-1,2-phenylacetyl-CoA epoxidase subunit PaaE
MHKFHTLLITEIRQETDDSVSIALEIPDTLKDKFTYSAGQYLTFKAIIDGEEVRRSYSVCSAPHEKYLRVGIKKVPGGKFSTYANEMLKAGDPIEVMPPEGNCTHIPDPGQANSYLAFAAGSGITPILSIIKTVLLKEPKSRFTLVYGNRYSQSVMFREELEGLKNKHVDRFRIYHILSRERTDAPLLHGRIDPKKCELFFTDVWKNEPFDKVFVCGPGNMIFDIKESLPALGIPQEKIKYELFTTPGQEQKKKRVITEEEAEKKCKVDLQLDGNKYQIDISFRDNILDAAIDLGIDLPYSCKGGVCSTCRAQLVEGEVDMEVNYALEEDELDAGFVLTCQCYPKSDHISINYDAV